MVLRHYRFSITFDETPDSPYVIQDMSGYFAYDTTTHKITKMCNGAVKHNNSVTQQLYASPKTVGTVTSDNLLGASTADTNFTTTPVHSLTSNTYVNLTSQPNFHFGKLILGNSFITIYNNDDVGNNIAQYWEVASNQDNHISLSFVQGVSDIWTPVDDTIATYTISFTQVSGDAPTTPACFVEGSKIYASINGKYDYYPIESLRKGHLVKTHLHRSKKIIFIGKNEMKNIPTVWNHCICKAKKDDSIGLFEDLRVTGAHSFLVDNLSETEKAKQIELYGTLDRKVDGKYLLSAWASDKFKTIQDDKTYTYYHLVLEHDGNVEKRYGIWANGILTESQCEKHFLTKHYKPIE